MNALLARQEDAVAAFVAIAVFLAIYGTFGIVCAVMAPGRGRSAIGWFFIGVFTQCLGIILLLLLPNLKVEEEKQRRRDEETRRLREQLKKERQVADERHGAHRTRLDVHDRALGVDTTAAEAPQLTAAAPPPLPLAASAPLPGERMWYFGQNGERHGPVPTSRLRQLWSERRITDEALVWCEGMQDWAPITATPELRPDGAA